MRRDPTSKRSVLETMSGIGLALLFIVVAIPAVGVVSKVLVGDLAQNTVSAERASAAEPAAETEPPTSESAERSWSCYYAPSMNDNWHDDVECARGLRRLRPELLAGKSFVTEAEMTAAAAVYEDKLNK